MMHLRKRLRVEQLETRTMLSASYGGAHVAPEPVGVFYGGWETGQRFEHRVEHRFDADGRVVTFADSAPQDVALEFPPPVWRPPFIRGRQPVVILVMGFHPTGNTVADTVTNMETSTGQTPESGSRPPLMGKAPLPPNDVPQPNFAWVVQQSPSEPLRFTSPPPSTGLEVSTTLPGLYAPSEVTTIATRPTTTASVRAHDVAIQGYSSRQLLLAAGAGSSADDDLEDDVDGERGRASIRGEANEIEALADSRLHDDVADSLDTLQRERAAIDEVLSELRELGPFADERGSDAAHSRPQVEPSEGAPMFAAMGERVAIDQPHSEPVAIVSHGGMVLLAAGGDANDSAYDLTAVIMNGAENATAMPIGTGAAVGVYQAFDVGMAQPRAAEANSGPRGNPAVIGQSGPSGGESGA